MKIKKSIILVASAVVVVGVITVLSYRFFVDSDMDSNEKQVDKGGMLVENVDGSWITENGSKYYVDLAGNRLIGEQLIDNEVYYFDNHGMWNGETPLKPMIIAVQLSTEQEAHISLTGGNTWIGNEIPVYYMTPDASSYSADVREITVTIHNNSDQMLSTGIGFRLLMWNGYAWVSSPADGMHHTDEGYTILPNDTLEMPCNFRDNVLEAGRYKLIKELQQPDDKSVNLIFSVEFELM